MRPTVSQYAEALEALSQDDSLSAGTLAKNLLGFLKRRGESGRAAAIVKHLEKRGAEQSGKLVVKVETAHELTDDSRTLLFRKAERIFPGKSIEFQYEIDDAVIGGARLRTDETLYDATVGAELLALKEEIQK